MVDLDDDSHIKAFQDSDGDVDKAFKPVAAPPKFFSKKYEKLSKRIREIVDEYSLVSMLPLDCSNDETITNIIYHADNNIQYGEGKEADESNIKAAEERMWSSDGPTPQIFES